MAVKGTEKVLGGTRATRYPDPFVKGTANAYGLYPWSVFTAMLGTGTATSFTALSSVSKAAQPLLLFLSDILATGTITDTDYTVAGSVKPLLSVGFFDATVGGSDLVVPVGKVGQGYVGTVACSGFPAVAETGAIAGAALITVFANSPNIASPISLQDWALPTSDSGALPVILRYSDYTAAIRDADNQIKTAGGVTYQIVGLHNAT
jgi:hypothetical protein